MQSHSENDPHVSTFIQRNYTIIVVKRLFSAASTLLFITMILLLLADVLGSNDSLEKHIGIDSRTVALIGITGLALLRTFFHQTLTTVISLINSYLLFPTFLLISLVLTFADLFSPPNYIFSITHLQHTQIFLLAVICGITMVLQKPNRWFKKNEHYTIFLGAFAIVITAEIVSMFPFEIFRIISHEDGFIENLQVINLLLAAFWSISIAKIFFQKKYLLYTFLFTFLSIGLFFASGDEIAWGQRIFDIATPETITKHNVQNEITVHNLNGIHQLVSLGYMFIGFLGAFGWLVQQAYSSLKKMPFTFLIPPWFTSAYFFVCFLYNLVAPFRLPAYVANWSEFVELMLYFGIMFTLFFWSQTAKKLPIKS